ncbi:MAG: hypothetical protein JSW46_14370 [Gemmatimonadota bacterium]|nr:MAG: hypothetical protein JSW46_14370 [Gemmatimonadota bacterium]
MRRPPYVQVVPDQQIGVSAKLAVFLHICWPAASRLAAKGTTPGEEAAG